MAAKQTVQITALRELYDANPAIFQRFLEAFTKDLGHASSSFTCPNCGTMLEAQTASGAGSVSRKQTRRKPSSALYDLIIQLARLRMTMVGDINSAFTKHVGPKGKDLSREEYRSRKEQWLRSEIAKELKKRSKSSAA